MPCNTGEENCPMEGYKTKPQQKFLFGVRVLCSQFPLVSLLIAQRLGYALYNKCCILQKQLLKLISVPKIAIYMASRS